MTFVAPPHWLASTLSETRCNLFHRCSSINENPMSVRLCRQPISIFVAALASSQCDIGKNELTPPT